MLRMFYALVVLGGCCMLGRTDEGMWLFSNPPRALLKEKYQLEQENEWYQHLQRASVRFNN
ncbi:MAG TPA: hypothetical protein PKA06_11515, partial [Gemmatales bacterium]|nr:hypothetical protein [Gemmatales bacterium]